MVKAKLAQSISINENKDTTYKPLVSVITPVRNGMKYLEICIRSVLNQSYPNIEHIFVDGGSTDGTLEVLASYQAKYPDRIRFITGRDKGVGDAVNKGLRIAKGEIFGWIDSDDIYEPDAIQTVVEFFRANPDACFVFGGCNMINEKGEVFACFIIKDFDLKEAVTDWHYIVFCAAFYKREVIKKAGYFNLLGNDLDFWLRVNKRFRMHRIGKTLANWRLHIDSISLAPAARENKIRIERYKQDFFLCLRYGGSISSPLAKRCRPAVLAWLYGGIRPMVNGLRPILGWSYPFLNKVVGRVIGLVLR